MILSDVWIFGVGVSFLCECSLKLYFFKDLSFGVLDSVLAVFSFSSTRSSFSSEHSETLDEFEELPLLWQLSLAASALSFTIYIMFCKFKSTPFSDDF